MCMSNKIIYLKLAHQSQLNLWQCSAGMGKNSSCWKTLFMLICRERKTLSWLKKQAEQVGFLLSQTLPVFLCPFLCHVVHNHSMLCTTQRALICYKSVKKEDQTYAIQPRYSPWIEGAMRVPQSREPPPPCGHSIFGNSGKRASVRPGHFIDGPRRWPNYPFMSALEFFFKKNWSS